MANEIYHRSNWGESKPEGFGDMYFDPSATNKLYNRSTYYENSDATDKILGDIPNKASIVLTPTGYSEDSINTAIPPYQVLPINLVSNPDFSDGSNNWSLGTGWAVSNNTAIHTGSTGNISTNASLTQGKKYVVEFEIISIADGVCNIYDTGSATTYSSFSSVGVKTATITKDSSSSLAIRSNSSNAVIDNVSVQEIQEADFTFARNSSATRVNQAGLIEDVNSGTELVTNGDFSDGTNNFTTQLNPNFSVTNGVATIESTGANSLIFQNISPSSVSAILKIEIDVVSFTGSNFSVNFSGSTTTINELGISTHLTSSSRSTNKMDIAPSANQTIVIRSISVKEIYEATDIPRLDYTTGQGAFLLEPQSTNLITKSEQPANWTYTEYGSGSAGTITTGKVDMFGSTNAVQVDFPSDAENVSINFGIATSSASSSTSYATSIYIKLLTSETKNIQFRTGASANTLAINSTDFVRYTATGTRSSNESFHLKLRPSQGTSGGGFSMIICQPQEETGTFVTSYIPTTGSEVTRSAETANSSGNSDLFNDSEGVLYAELASLAENVGSNKKFSISSGATSNSVTFSYRGNDNQIQVLVRSGGTTTVNLTTTISPAVTNFFKIAIKYKTDDFALFVNGTKVGTDTSCAMPTGLNTLNFDRGDGGQDYIGKVKCIAVFKEALTDAELTQLTS